MVRRPVSDHASIGGPVSAAGLESLRRRSVRSVTLEADVDCSFVAELPDLVRVTALRKQTDDSALWEHPGIEHLRLDYDSRVPMDARSLPRLASLTVGRRPGLDSVADHRHLERLHAGLRDLTDLDWLGRPPSLRSLGVWGRGQTLDLAGLSRVPALEELSVDSVRVVSLRPVGRLTRLTRLALGVTNTLGGLVALDDLAGLTRLTHVALGPVQSLRPVTVAWLPDLLHVSVAEVADGDVSLLDRDWRRAARREMRRRSPLPPALVEEPDDSVMDDWTFWTHLDAVRITSADADLDAVVARLENLLATLPERDRDAFVPRFRREVRALEGETELRAVVSRNEPIGDDLWENVAATLVMLGAGGVEQLRHEPMRVDAYPLLAPDSWLPAERILLVLEAL